jgi:hypothetical protein
MISIAGHTLFPHHANWAVAPAWQRRWQTGIGSGVTGAEQRAAARALPLHNLSFAITPYNLQERLRLDARMDQALKSGYACAPFFGRACFLAAGVAAGAAALDLVAPAAWSWAAGDYAILLRDDEIYDVILVSSVAGSTLNLDDVLTCAWLRGDMVRPVLFGTLAAEKQSPDSPWYATLRIAITQLVAERNAQLGSTPAHIPGVGEQVIGSTNTIL